jgi:hypothetical protein
MECAQVLTWTGALVSKLAEIVTFRTELMDTSLLPIDQKDGSIFGTCDGIRHSAHVIGVETNDETQVNSAT